VSDEHARRVFRQLQALARADYGGNTGALLVVYGVEGFLRRLAAFTIELIDYRSEVTLNDFDACLRQRGDLLRVAHEDSDRFALRGEQAGCLCSNLASGGDQDHVDVSLAVEM
jgi:hypothetical protein